MKYLKSKPGSLEASAGQVSGFATEQEYQKMFKKELDKAGKGIGSMSPKEKKDFFNKIDKMYKAKNEITAAQKKLPPALQKAIKDKEMKKEDFAEAKDTEAELLKLMRNINPKSQNYEAIMKGLRARMAKLRGKKEELDKDDTSAVKKVKDMLKKASQAHAGQAKELDKALKEKDSYGNEINKAKHAAYKDPKAGEHKPVDPKPSLKSVAKTVKEMMKRKKDDVSTMADTEKDKEKKTTLVGSKKTPVDTKPEVEYKN